MSEALARITKKERALQAELRRFKRRVLAELLELLTPSQLDRFKKIYGTTDPTGFSLFEIRSAIQLCERTIEKNKDTVLEVIAERHV